MRTPRLLLPGALLLLTACGGDAGLPFSADPYFVSFSRGEQWQREPNALHKATRSEISRYFRDDAEQIDGALIRMAGGFGIFHFNKDATLKGKASDSDYMALMLIGAGPVYAVNCP
jgi:hypothetical protein